MLSILTNKLKSMFCIHKYTLWQKEKCFERQERKCTKCGKIQHAKCLNTNSFGKWNNNPCEGTRVRICVDCGAFEKEKIEVFHNWSNYFDITWNSTVQSTTMYRECRTCKKIEKHFVKKVLH